MNPSTALAAVLIDEWVRCGVREVVLCPGSRSAPLAYAVQQAEREGRLRLHVRVDERSAGFLALGLAKVSRRAALVITTSGTAVANLHPAVLEAHHGCVPLVVLSADRPAQLRGTGANQTTVQPGIFAGAVRWERDLPPAPVESDGWPGGDDASSGWAVARQEEQASWRSTVCRGWAAATGWQGDPGPVHLNVAFRDPLAPDPTYLASDGSTGQQAVDEQILAGRPGAQPWVVLGDSGGRVRATPEAAAEHRAGMVARTLVVLGDLPEPAAAQSVLDVTHRRGWPVIAEPFGTSDRRGVLPHGPLLLCDEQFVAGHLPDRVLTVGRLTLSREIAALLRHPGVEVQQVTAVTGWTDPGHVVTHVHRLDDWLAATGAAGDADDSTRGHSSEADDEWVIAWRAAGARVAQRLVTALGDADSEAATGPGVAAAVLGGLGPQQTLVLGSSNPPRDLDVADDGTHRRTHTVVGNRGLAGIDGTVSTAIGVALAGGRTLALMGDLTFLHDSNGLLLGPDEPRPDLSIVVVNDDGGGVFATLEYGSPERATDFERVFGTPTGADLAAVCAAYGVAHRRLDGIPALVEALGEPGTGIRVLEVPVDRSQHRSRRQHLVDLARGATDPAEVHSGSEADGPERLDVGAHRP